MIPAPRKVRPDTRSSQLSGKRDGSKFRSSKTRLATTSARRLGVITKGAVRGERPAREAMKEVPRPKDAGKDYRPYARPRYWAPFVLIGDPE